ncbi:hypothetical protein M8C21_027052 [Ambrosia artemisiifolia]|uniref:Regulator of Vps4 activity in the MVB pathway protein n=1 Tax=Ambrosia artemisiifolia TaxID=4212 RepID=A0AAD5G878_AMBAR|nr:hypothetical protein M8C21_027052 [Ambrosia artemisiifolia]
MRRDIALLLQSGQDATARIRLSFDNGYSVMICDVKFDDRVEHVMREQNILAANEFIELFCELIVQRLTIIAKQRECPADLKEGISSLIFAAPRCSEIPELVALRDIFEKKYGKDFVAAATDLRPDCGVNRMLIDKLSVRTPAGELKLKVLKEIAKEYQIDWDTTESETELLKPPEKLIDGPPTFMSASTMPIKPPCEEFVQPNNPPSRRYSDNSHKNMMHFDNTKSAAEAAAESAKMAIAAAEAAAYLASKESNQSAQPHGYVNGPKSSINFDSVSSNSPPIDFGKTSRQSSERSHISQGQRRHSYNASGVKFDESDCDEQADIDYDKTYRRHTYNAPPPVSSVKFDEYESDDYDEEIEMEHDHHDHDRDHSSRTNHDPPNRPAPPAPTSGNMKHGQRVHPKLPDYDTLAARFEALKHHKY